MKSDREKIEREGEMQVRNTWRARDRRGMHLLKRARYVLSGRAARERGSYLINIYSYKASRVIAAGTGNVGQELFSILVR